MRCLSKKILCYILIGLLTFSVTSTVYYKSVHAMEWVGGALAFEEALKWLLAAIGITATAGMTDAYWDTYGDDFTYYAIENGATQTEVAEWQLKACQGIIDKGSVVWQKFKAWASELVSGSSSGDSLSWTSGTSYSDTVSALNAYFGVNIPLVNDYINQNIYAISVIHYSSGNVYYNLYYSTYFNYSNLLSYGSGTLYFSNAGRVEVWFSSSTGNYTTQYRSGNSSLGLNGNTVYITNNCINSSVENIGLIVLDSGGAVADSNFESTTTNVNDLDVISSDGVDENADEVTVPMPGVSDSDNEASKDAYQDIIDAINDGTITQEQGVEQIQEILKIVTYDTVTDKVVPPQVEPDTGEDKTKDDVLKENKDNMGFTIGGLEAVFPFCIPFDIYAFMTLLVAEPQCPEFDFPVKSVNGEVEEIHIDLEPFEPVAVVVRYCFDFLFIIGLAMLTRSLMGGGSSD